MRDLEAALQNPFSMETAYLKYRENMAEASRMKAEIQSLRETGEVSTRELLLRTVEALGLLTDNTAFLRIMRNALEARDSK